MKNTKKMTIYDKDDKALCYLVTFKHEVDMEDVERIGKEVREELEDYTFEDLFERLNENFSIETIDDLCSLERLSF